MQLIKYPITSRVVGLGARKYSVLSSEMLEVGSWKLEALEKSYHVACVVFCCSFAEFAGSYVKLIGTH